MAHKKGQGSSRNGRDSPGQHRGIKIYGGEHVISGNIIVRQVGTVVHPGVNVGMGRDFTIFSVTTGVVKYERLGKDRKRVSVYPAGDARLTLIRDPRPPKKAKPDGADGAKAEGKPAAKAKAPKPEAKA